jgi:uncharacterized repeat protein (TIGR03803 family)
MHTKILKSKILFSSAALLLGLFVPLVEAQNLVTLYNFKGGTNGVWPSAGLVLSGNTLYGTTEYGGPGSGLGTLFAVNTNGTHIAYLHYFGSGEYDGDVPYVGLILSGKTLYGTTSGGGPFNGTVFAVNTNGTAFTNLHSFTEVSGHNSTNGDGSEPVAGLILSGNTL